MNLQNGISNFNIPSSIHFFFNSSLERVTIFFLASIILFYTILKVVFNFVENSWWNKKNHQYDNLKTNFV